MPTTFRHDISAGIVSVLNTFIAAHPTLLLRAYGAQPPGFPDLPAAYVDTTPEAIHHDSGTRTRLMSPSVVVCWRITDNEETMDRIDLLVDLLVDAFTASPQFVLGTIWSDMTIADEDAPFGNYDLAGVRFTFQNITIQEGRV